MRWVPQLEQCFPKLSKEELPAVGAAIWAVNRVILQRVLQGKLDLSAQQVMEFAVTWSLRALRVPEEEIESIVQTALRHHLTQRAAAGQGKKKPKA